MPLQCYNKSCGQEFEEVNNNDIACLYHPGLPVFHEGLKGWSCCKKRVIDFGEFLTMKGCTQGRHSNIKPVPINQQPKAATPSPIPSPVTTPKQQPIISTEEFNIQLHQSHLAKTQLEEFHAKWLEQQAHALNSEIEEGTACKNKACKESYREGLLPPCIYHPGKPVFHEGMKYWSCCDRKTSDFQAFLDQKGCATGNHLWKEIQTNEKTVQQCRYDHFQGGKSITMNIYAKHINPDQSNLIISEGKLKAHLVFDETKVYDMDITLKGIVVPSECTAKVLPTKLEVILVKATPDTWSQLEG